jgi:GntR family transcriptional regulator
MNREWNDNEPIYRQLRDRMVHMILTTCSKKAIPCPRCATWPPNRVNPLTVLKAYQELVTKVWSKRGAASACCQGGRAQIIAQGRASEISSEHWPRVHATIQLLGLNPKELLDAAARNSNRKESR